MRTVQAKEVYKYYPRQWQCMPYCSEENQAYLTIKHKDLGDMAQRVMAFATDNTSVILRDPHDGRKRIKSHK